MKNEKLLKDRIQKAINILGRPVMSYVPEIAIKESDKKIEEAVKVLLQGLKIKPTKWKCIKCKLNVNNNLKRPYDYSPFAPVDPIGMWEVVLLSAIGILICLIIF